MKTFVLIVALLSTVIVVQAQTTPIYHGKLQSDLNGGGNNITNTANVVLNSGIVTNSNPSYGYTNVVPLGFVVSIAGDGNANGNYLMTAAPNIWTNVNGLYGMVSNTSNPRWTFTNSAGVIQYQKNLAAIPNMSGLFTAVNGAPTPTPTVFITIGAYPTNPLTQIASPYPIYTPLNSNNVTLSASVENGGSDIMGRPGFYPFASLSPLMQPIAATPQSIYSQAPSIFTNCNNIYVGAGNFVVSNTAAASPNNLSIIGKGRNTTFITGQGVFTSNNSLQMQLGSSNYIKDINFTGIFFFNTASVGGIGFTNCTIDDSTINGDLDGFYASGNVGLYGLNMNNDTITSWWDCFFGVQTAIIKNCDFYSVWLGTNSLSGRNTNTAAQASFSGLTCVRIEPQSTSCNYTIIGGTMTISNGPTTGWSQATNACIKITDSGAFLHLRGVALNHYSTNSSFAISNPLGATNVDGWFYDNGAYTVVVGTNYFKWGLITTTTPLAADFQNSPGTIDWVSNQTRWISSYNGTSVSTSKVGP